MKKRREDFVHLHVHSDMSQLDGCGKIGEYAQKAKDMGHAAIALTEHGTMRQYFTQLEECEERDLKPIYGIEFYVANNMHRKGLTTEEKDEIAHGMKQSERKVAIKEYEEREGIRDRWHLTVWAKNEVGLKNLFKLSTNAWMDGFYYKPRIDIAELIKYKDGLIVATGCQSSIIYDHVCVGKRQRALSEAQRLYEEFGENLWLEIMPHEGNDQILSNKFAIELSKRYPDLRMVATQDAHYVDASDFEAHEVLLCIGTGDSMHNENRFRFGDGELYLKTRKEMFNSFVNNHCYMDKRIISKALNNTLEVANIIEDGIIKIDRFACLMPPVDVPKKFGGNEFSYIKALCIHGWEWREIPKRAEYYAAKNKISYEEAIRIYKFRLKHELAAVKRQKFITYFLLVRDIYNWARKQDIMCGPGRGSAAGSLVAFLLGITSVDPVEHALLFERFINPARVDMPDIDMDFEDVRRQEIIQYLRDKYGEDRVSQIATVGRLSGKQCLKDVSRVLEVPYVAVNEVTKSIIERSSGDERASQTIEDSFKDFAVCREFNKKYPDVLKYARRLEGMSKNLGIHAAGVVTSPVPLVDITPLEVRKHSDGEVVVTAVDMNGAQAHGLLKLDVLGLRTLAVLKDAVRAAQQRHGVEIDLERLELNDEKVLQAFTDHDYAGIFQYDSPGADKICAGVVFDSFEDVAAMTALNRPGTARSGLATEYVERKKHPEKRKQGHFHPKVSEITADTMGVIVYQEHVQKIFVEIAGFPPGTADSLRKKIAKKYGDETIGKERENFIRGAKEHSGIDEKTAGKIMDAITFFGCLAGDTPIFTPYGWKMIGELKDGDEIYSCDDFGGVVRNNIRTVAPTGRKFLNKITLEGGETVKASDDHWWRVSGGEYVKTKKLAKNDDLLYPKNLNAIRNKKGVFGGLQNRRMRKKNFSQRVMFSTLPKRISKKKNGSRNAGRISKYKNGNSRERMEGRFGQITFFREKTLGSYEGRRKSGLDRRTLFGIQRNERNVAERNEDVRMVRKKTGRELFRAEYEKFTCSPYRSKSFEQQTRKSRCDMSVLPFVETRTGKSGWDTKKIRKIEKIGVAETWDIECLNEPHNYIAPGCVLHNSYGFNKSHATSYGVIAYWGMWLKVYYPLEFYWALLKNAPDRLKIASFAKDAKKHAVTLLPPDVSVSKQDFAIDGAKNSIRGSLVDIKGVGKSASESIMENQPYVSFADFLDRVERRKVHKGVVMALAKSGAFGDFVPNVKWFVENMDDFWKKYGAKKTRVEALKDLEHSRELPDYPEEEKQLISSKVNPLAFGKHPVDAYEDFISRNIKVPLVLMSDEDFWKDNNGDGIYIYGVILEVKYNQIGDFHTGELPSESERKKMFWGRRYANVNVEDSGGAQYRVKFDIDIFDEYRTLIDSGIGTPVIVHAIPNEKYENLKANFAIDLEVLRKKIENNVILNVWEKIVCGRHPIGDIEWKSTKNMTVEKIKEQRIANILFFKNRTRKFTGVVLQCRLKYDKNEKIMAFFSMVDANNNFIECICFSSNWSKELKEIIKIGNLLSIELDRKRDIRNKRKIQYFFNGGRIHLYCSQSIKKTSV